MSNNQLYYIHNDHLGHPEAITGANQAVVWKAQTSSYDSSVVQNSLPLNGYETDCEKIRRIIHYTPYA